MITPTPPLLLQQTCKALNTTGLVLPVLWLHSVDTNCMNCAYKRGFRCVRKIQFAVRKSFRCTKTHIRCTENHFDIPKINSLVPKIKIDVPKTQIDIPKTQIGIPKIKIGVSKIIFCCTGIGFLPFFTRFLTLIIFSNIKNQIL